MSNAFLVALATTTLAGLSTGLGGLLVLWVPPRERAVSVALGFAGGVMLCVSFVSIVPEAMAYYAQVAQSPLAAGCAAASLLLIGMVLAGLLGALLPDENALFMARDYARRSARGHARNKKHTQRGSTAHSAPQTVQNAAQTMQDTVHLRARARALHCGVAVALALMLHNLPEGILTLFTTVEDPRMGFRLSLAIAMHNIPEGISIAAPLWYATHSRWKSAGAAFLSGLAEPAGALVAYGLLRNCFSPQLLHGISLLVAGAMCWVSVSELLFGGFSMRQKLPTCAGFSCGVAVMLLGISAFS